MGIKTIRPEMIEFLDREYKEGSADLLHAAFRLSNAFGIEPNDSINVVMQWMEDYQKHSLELVDLVVRLGQSVSAVASTLNGLEVVDPFDFDLDFEKLVIDRFFYEDGSVSAELDEGSIIINTDTDGCRYFKEEEANVMKAYLEDLAGQLREIKKLMGIEQ